MESSKVNLQEQVKFTSRTTREPQTQMQFTLPLPLATKEGSIDQCEFRNCPERLKWSKKCRHLLAGSRVCSSTRTGTASPDKVKAPTAAGLLRLSQWKTAGEETWGVPRTRNTGPWPRGFDRRTCKEPSGDGYARLCLLSHAKLIWGTVMRDFESGQTEDNISGSVLGFSSPLHWAVSSLQSPVNKQSRGTCMRSGPACSVGPCLRSRGRGFWNATSGGRLRLVVTTGGILSHVV